MKQFTPKMQQSFNWSKQQQNISIKKEKYKYVERSFEYNMYFVTSGKVSVRLVLTNSHTATAMKHTWIISKQYISQETILFPFICGQPSVKLGLFFVSSAFPII